MKGLSQCVKFEFVVGDTLTFDIKQKTMLVVSNPTNKFCFYDKTSVSLVNQTYSRLIGSNKAFREPFMVQVDMKKQYF